MKSVKLNITGIWEWGIYGLIELGSYGKVSCFLFWKCSKNAGLHSDCMTTGFSPFDLLTCDVLQRGHHLRLVLI